MKEQRMKLSADRKAGMMGVLVLALGIGLMIMGIRNGEVQVVLEKAIKICMECIGIG